MFITTKKSLSFGEGFRVRSTQREISGKHPLNLKSTDLQFL